MNKIRHPLDKNNRKKINKEVKNLIDVYLSEETEIKKDTKTKDQQSNNTQKHKKHSKRTTPGEVLGKPTAPTSIHPESTKWTKTLSLQAKTKKQSLDKKLSKHK